MDINPFVPLEQVTSYRKHHTTLDYGLNDYYVIWQSKKISWIEANKKCTSVGGSIIKGSTQEEIALVEQLILGIPFGSENLHCQVQFDFTHIRASSYHRYSFHFITILICKPQIFVYHIFFTEPNSKYAVPLIKCIEFFL